MYLFRNVSVTGHTVGHCTTFVLEKLFCDVILFRVDNLWAMAKNGSSRCFLAKNGCTLKTIAAESVVGRI